ncbi:MAG: hypothetical protein AB7O67_03680 [Vicinamibacterales bacterium]
MFATEPTDAGRCPMTRSRSLPAALVVVLAATVLAAAGCNRFVDPTTVLTPDDVVTGWYDAGILEDGKNKLVPSISLKLRNTSDEPLKSVQINAIFRRVGEQEMWGEHYGWAIQSEPLAPGAETDELVLRSALGYTGVQPRMQMLQNSNFVDAKVEIFLKQGSRVWAKLAEFPIERQLLTQ